MTKEFFAHEIDGVFYHVFPSIMQVRMCGDEPVIPVDITIDGDGSYYGWMDKRDNEISPCMIFPHFSLLAMCFPYGIKAEIEAGHGEVVRLTVGRKQ